MVLRRCVSARGAPCGGGATCWRTAFPLLSTHRAGVIEANARFVYNNIVIKIDTINSPVLSNYIGFGAVKQKRLLAVLLFSGRTRRPHKPKPPPSAAISTV